MKRTILKKMALVAATFGIYASSPCNAQEYTKSDQQKIDILLKKIHAIKDIKTYPMPDSLKPVQNSYIELTYFVNQHENIIDSLDKTNWNLCLDAYDKYSVRIGKNFLLTKYFKPWELATIQQMVKKTTIPIYYDLVQTNAYTRIMNNSASLADLLEFYTDIDFNIINQRFETKFFPTNNSSLSPIYFSNNNITNDINKELILLLNSWTSNKAYVDLPNFRIPEMRSIKKTYLQNDKKIDHFMKQYNEMCSYEQRLQNFARQEHKRLSDSLSVLINRQNQHSK